MKRYVLLDHDGVLVDTEGWYFEAGRRALADVGLTLDKQQYLHDMNLGRGGTWAQARAAGVDEHTIDRQPVVRDAYYRHGPRHGPSLAPGSSGEGDVDAELRVA